MKFCSYLINDISFEPDAIQFRYNEGNIYLCIDAG
jgi:hypothetical protein